MEFRQSGLSTNNFTASGLFTGFGPPWVSSLRGGGGASNWYICLKMLKNVGTRNGLKRQMDRPQLKGLKHKNNTITAG